jgi:hypothetical protein
MAYHIRLIELLTLDNQVQGPVGIVYSTAPRTAIGVDGRRYYVKGCNDPLAFAEVCGCRLAASVGLPVPDATIGSFAGDFYAAVTEVESKVQNVAPWLKSPAGITNLEDLFGTVVVDSWLANDDRNLGNLVGTPAGNRQIRLTMIDFEKSKTLAINPTIESARLDPRRLWPTSELGVRLQQIRPPHPPRRYLDSIRSVTPDAVREIVLSTARDVPPVTWSEAAIDVLLARARRIQTIMEEIWPRN